MDQQIAQVRDATVRPAEAIGLRRPNSRGVAASPAKTDPLAELSAQQREIVKLAAQGLRNQQIAERLMLSPRTVSSHLYRVYPKLGVSSRHQLRDLFDDR